MKRPGSRPGLINEDGVERPYDPYIDDDVPASWLGPPPPDPDNPNRPRRARPMIATDIYSTDDHEHDEPMVDRMIQAWLDGDEDTAEELLAELEHEA